MVQVFARTATYMWPKEPLSRPVSVFLSLRFLAFLAPRGVKSSHVSSTFTCLVEQAVISAGHFHRLKLFERTIGSCWTNLGMIVFHWNVIVSPVFANWKFLLWNSFANVIYIFFPGREEESAEFIRRAEISEGINVCCLISRCELNNRIIIFLTNKQNFDPAWVVTDSYYFYP